MVRMTAHRRMILVFLGLDEDLLLLRDPGVFVRVIVHQQRPYNTPHDARRAEEVEHRLPPETGPGEKARHRHTDDRAPCVACREERGGERGVNDGAVVR